MKMSPHLKFGLLFLLLCTVAFLIFVNFVENNILDANHLVVAGANNETSAFAVVRRDDEDSKRLLLLRDAANLEYIIRPACRSAAIVWIVTSYAGDPTPRSALRRAYPDDELRELGVTRVFLLGLLDDAAQRKSAVSQAAVVNESERFRDVLQGNFNEAYRNLTYKHLMGLKWATESCPDARHVVKQDDDIVVNLYEILKKLRQFRADEQVLAGYVLRNMRAVREPANKWYVTRDEFPDDVYPDFLSGWLYVASRDVAARIVERCLRRDRVFWIDDVFLTGIVRQEVKARLTDMREMYTTDYRFLSCCVRGKARRLRCEFAVGPNGGKAELQVAFRDFAEFCEKQCESRAPELSVGKTCVVEYEESRVQTGSAKIEPIQFL